MMYTDWRRRWAQAGTVVPNGRLPPLHRTAASRASIVFALQFFLLRSLLSEKSVPIFTHRDALGNMYYVSCLSLSRVISRRAKNVRFSTAHCHVWDIVSCLEFDQTGPCVQCTKTPSPLN